MTDERLLVILLGKSEVPVRVTSKGQVTIPVEIRERFGIDSDTEVEFVVVGNTVQLRKVTKSRERGRRIVGRLLRTGYAGPSTEDLLALTRGEG